MDWKKIGLHTSVYFTLLAAVILGSWMMTATEFMEFSFPAYRVLCFLPFSLLFAIGNVNFKYAEKSSLAMRTLIHFVLTAGSFYVFFYLPTRNEESTIEIAFAMAVIIIAAYWVLMGTFLFLRSRFVKIDRDSQKYTSLYRRKKNGPPEKKPSKEKNEDYKNVYKKK